MSICSQGLRPASNGRPCFWNYWPPRTPKPYVSIAKFLARIAFLVWALYCNPSSLASSLEGIASQFPGFLENVHADAGGGQGRHLAPLRGVLRSG